MFNPFLHMDRRQLAAKLYNDPSLAFSGDSKQAVKHRQEMSVAIARNTAKKFSNSPTNINREALYVLDNYPILRNQPKSNQPRLINRCPLSADTNYFAPCYLPKNFKAPQSPQAHLTLPKSNRPHSAAIYSTDDYSLVEGSQKQFVSWKRLSAKPRASVQSAGIPQTISSSAHHEFQTVCSNTSHTAMDDISTAVSQGGYEVDQRWPSKNSKSFTDSQIVQNLHPEQNKAMQIEVQIAEKFNTLRHEIISYIKGTGTMYPRSPLEVNTLHEMLTDLEAKQQIYNDFVRSKYRDNPIILCQCLSNGIDSLPQSSRSSTPSVRIISSNGDYSMERNITLEQLNHNDAGTSSGSILSLIMRTQRAIQSKLDTMKASCVQPDMSSSLHDSLGIKLIHPWVRGYSSSHISTTLHLGDCHMEESEIGIAPLNTDRQMSNSQVDNCTDVQAFHEFTLSTSTSMVLHSADEKQPLSKESCDYDSPAVALVFMKEVDNLSNRSLVDHQLDDTVMTHNTIHQLVNQNLLHHTGHEEEDMFLNYYSHLDRFRGAGSPKGTAVPTNSHMQQDARDMSSPDVAGIYTSRSVQHVPINNLKTPDYEIKPQIVNLENTIGYLERNKAKHNTAISIIQPRRCRTYCAVRDYTEKEPGLSKDFLRAPISSPRRVTLELNLNSPESPLKFGFLSTIKVKTAEATRRTSEAVVNTIHRINTGTRELTEISSAEQHTESNKTPSRLAQVLHDTSSTSPVNKVLLTEIKRYITSDISAMYAKFIGTLQEELAKKLKSVERDLQSGVKTATNQRKAEYENVRLTITENKNEIMKRISYIQESIKATLAAHKSGAKNLEKKVQLSLARAGIHERIPQIGQAIIEKLKDIYCVLSRCLGNWVAMGYEQCTAVTCQGTAGNGIRYILFPCGDSVCDSCHSVNPTICPICLKKYELSVRADDSHCFNGPSSMLPTHMITSSCSRLRDLLLCIMKLEDVEVLGYDDAEKKFLAKDSTASWQAYSRKLDVKGLNKHCV
ncbi:Hypothetical protein GLP15_4256 [Giardia lamblia P15]|uniref:Uncharacterized protein n=1 Tax=Giardia intestinalis (strain P15) TaxID=658858 RepID=E1EY10_GIAIA|nr:Hypothetical protein GLP15_4256 [Giardia lamblia P15]